MESLARAVRMVQEIRRESGESHGVITRVAKELDDDTPAEFEAAHYRRLDHANAA